MSLSKVQFRIGHLEPRFRTCQASFPPVHPAHPACPLLGTVQCQLSGPGPTPRLEWNIHFSAADKVEIVGRSEAIFSVKTRGVFLLMAIRHTLPVADSVGSVPVIGPPGQASSLSDCPPGPHWGRQSAAAAGTPGGNVKYIFTRSVSSSYLWGHHISSSGLAWLDLGLDQEVSWPSELVH